MKISTMLGYSGGFKQAAREVTEMEKAGLDLVWVAEAYGFDSPSLMGYLAALTEKVEIGAARSRFSLRTFPVADFPTLPEPPEPATFLPAGGLASALHQVVRAASGDDARPLLTGVLIAPEGGGVRLVATDSYRLALRDIDGAAGVVGEEDILVPARALSELQRLINPGDEGTVGVTTTSSEIILVLVSRFIREP